MRYPRFVLLGLLMLAAMVAAGVLVAPWPGAQASEDSDGDGFTNDVENHIGTDPLDACPDDPSDDAWPPDFDTNRVINITDVFRVLPPTFGTSTGQADFDIRADLAPDGVINITDVFRVLPPIFGASCSP